jgi:hypothetical protein
MKNGTDYVVTQPLTAYHWPFDVPTRLWQGVWVTKTPQLPTGKNSLLQWSLSGREIQELPMFPFWITLKFRSDDSQVGKRQHRAITLVRYTRLAIQLIAPVGCDMSTIIVLRPNGVYSAAHLPSMTSTPWGRVAGYESYSLSEIRAAVRGVNTVFRFRVPQLINALLFLELGFGTDNPYISTFLWTSALDALLMAANPATFKDRLVNVLGDKTFVLPRVDPLGQPKYTVGEVADDIYEFRSKIAHGQLIPKKFLDPATLKDVNDNDIKVYTPYGPLLQYHHVIRECVLFLLIRVLRKIFLYGHAKTLLNAKAWRAKLNSPW